MEHCPICSNELQVRDCAPCDDCGWDQKELNHFIEKKHIYKTYDIYNGLQLTLCNFCDVDFGSYMPETFGLKNKQRIGFQDFRFIKDIKNPQIQKRKFCPECKRTLTFLNFLFDIRQLNTQNTTDI